MILLLPFQEINKKTSLVHILLLTLTRTPPSTPSFIDLPSSSSPPPPALLRSPSSTYPLEAPFQPPYTDAHPQPLYVCLNNALGD